MTAGAGPAKSESERAALQNAITSIDPQINRSVYELYGLTKEAIQLVEGTTQTC